jgi:hypothetical protein
MKVCKLLTFLKIIIYSYNLAIVVDLEVKAKKMIANK